MKKAKYCVKVVSNHVGTSFSSVGVIDKDLVSLYYFTNCKKAVEFCNKITACAMSQRYNIANTEFIDLRSKK